MKFNIWNSLAIIIILLLMATSLYLYGLNVATHVQISRLTGQKKTMEKELDAAYKEKDALGADMDSIKKEKEALVGKISDYEARIQEMKAGHEAKTKDMEAELDRLRISLKGLPEKEAEINSLKAALQEDKNKIGRLNKKLMKMMHGTPMPDSKSVSLQPITVTQESKKLSAKVLEVNGEYGFIVVNAGSKDGVKTGDTLFVSKNKDLLGKVVVEKVSDSVCIAKMLYKEVSDNVRKGDQVSN